MHTIKVHMYFFFLSSQAM